MKTVHYITTLFYYDGPQVFEARDDIGGNYIAVAVELQYRQDGYLVKGVNPRKAAEFRVGDIDLRTLLLDLQQEQWYLSTPDPDLNQPVSLIPQTDSIRESEFLPDEDFFLHEFPADDLVVKEARKRNNTILEIKAESLVNASEHRIRWDIFNPLSACMQSLLKYAYAFAMKDAFPNKRPNKTFTPTMDIVATAPGSFRIILEATQKSDIFDDNQLNYALEKIDALFAAAKNSDTDSLQEYRGHFAGSCLNLLKLLVKHNTGIGYAWANQNSLRPSTFTLSATRAKPLVESLSKITDLGVEEVTLTGEFDKVTRDSGAWGLHTKDGKKSGKIKKGGPSLNGLQVGKSYHFYCVEEITQSATGGEIHTLYLQGYKSVQTIVVQASDSLAQQSIQFSQSEPQN